MWIPILVSTYDRVPVGIEGTHVERINWCYHGRKIQQVGGIELIVHFRVLVLAGVYVVYVSTNL